MMSLAKLCGLGLDLAVVPALALALCACGTESVQGGEVELEFEGGVLDGSEDPVPPARLASDEELAANPREAAVELERAALAASYETMPLDELLTSMGLSIDEQSDMVQLSEEVIRQLAIARIGQEAKDAGELKPPKKAPRWPA